MTYKLLYVHRLIQTVFDFFYGMVIEFTAYLQETDRLSASQKTGDRPQTGGEQMENKD